MITLHLPPTAAAIAKELMDYSRQLRLKQASGLLGFTELRERVQPHGVNFANIGVGVHLEKILLELERTELPLALTYLVMSKGRKADYEHPTPRRLGITSKNVVSKRAEAVAYDWSKVSVDVVES